VGDLFKQRNRRTTKSELVILLKPTIVQSDRNWQQDLSRTRDRLRALMPAPTVTQPAPAAQQPAPAAEPAP
jgi:type II secretory pathway component GspD/PulD (secretin)